MCDATCIAAIYPRAEIIYSLIEKCNNNFSPFWRLSGKDLRGGGERERLTFANPAGKGGRILNAVGRLSNLYLFTGEGVPIQASGLLQHHSCTGFWTTGDNVLYTFVFISHLSMQFFHRSRI